ncbi:MAG: molecular chaperone TorD family protein [Shimia sp.]|uniref:molecular chaperone TorD family protein n=1 Tax=Shimia sp. TaxID=1954381 RepID=UPI004057FAB0
MNATEMQGHADVCRWLAQLFMTEVTKDQLAAYQTDAAAVFLDHIATVADIAHARRTFEAAIAELDEVDNPQRLLAADFAALLLLGELNNAQPYAGLYVEGAILGRSHDRMRARLENIGLAPVVNEPADHASFMLEYLALCLADDRATGESAKVFISAELLPWIAAWAKAAKTVPTRNQFYPVAVDLTKRYLQALVFA